jgi:hypothetical protein
MLEKVLRMLQCLPKMHSNMSLLWLQKYAGAKEGSFVRESTVPPNEGVPIKKRPFNQISNASDSDQADSEGVMLVDENSE